MFSNIKNTIRELAQNAVAIAEQALAGEAGEKKKQMAIDYVLSNLPISPIFKKLVSMFLASFIDDAVEFAVEYMNSLKNEK